MPKSSVIQLTSNGKPIWYNLSPSVPFFFYEDSYSPGTVIRYAGDEPRNVKETPEEILAKLEQT